MTTLTSASIDLTFSCDFNLQEPICCAFVNGGYGPKQRPPNRQYPALQGYIPGYVPPYTSPYDRMTDVDVVLCTRNEHGGPSARAAWDVGDRSTITSITAWRDCDWTPANYRDYTGLPIYTKVNNPTVQDQYSQEFPFNPEGTGFDFVTGLFAFHQTIRTSCIQETRPAASKWLLDPTSALSNNLAVLDNVAAMNDVRLDNTGVAADGKLNREVTDRLTLSPSLRVNYDKKQRLYDSVVTGAASNGTRQIVLAVPCLLPCNAPRTAAQRGIQTSQFFEPEFSTWNLSHDVNMASELTDDFNLYATYTRFVDAPCPPELSGGTVATCCWRGPGAIPG